MCSTAILCLVPIRVHVMCRHAIYHAIHIVQCPLQLPENMGGEVAGTLRAAPDSRLCGQSEGSEPRGLSRVSPRSCQPASHIAIDSPRALRSRANVPTGVGASNASAGPGAPACTYVPTLARMPPCSSPTSLRVAHAVFFCWLAWVLPCSSACLCWAGATSYSVTAPARARPTPR